MGQQVERCAPGSGADGRTSILVGRCCGGEGKVDVVEREKGGRGFAVDAICHTELPCTQECLERAADDIGLPHDAEVVEGALADMDIDFDGEQDHLLNFVDRLPQGQRKRLEHDYGRVSSMKFLTHLQDSLETLNRPARWEAIARPHELSWAKKGRPKLEKGACVTRVENVAERKQAQWRCLGLDMLGSSSVAVVLLAGSNDRRLGNGVLPGTCDIGLLSGKSMFQVFSERLLRLKHIVDRHMHHRECERAQTGVERDDDGGEQHQDAAAQARARILQAVGAARTSAVPEKADSSAGSGDDSEASSDVPEWKKQSNARRAKKKKKLVVADDDKGDDEDSESGSAKSSSNNDDAVSSASPASPTSPASPVSPAFCSRRASFAASCSESNSDDDKEAASDESIEVLRKEQRAQRRASIHVIEANVQASTEGGVSIPLYVMCSEDNAEEIEEFFVDNGFFGLPEADVAFFVQGTMPAMSPIGRVYLQEQHRIALHPNGGGGVFNAMLEEGIIAEMKSRGIENVFMASQDNLLLRVADPLFLGHCAYLDVRTGVKCVTRDGDEPFGMLCSRRRLGFDADGDGVMSVEEQKLCRLSPCILERAETSIELLHGALPLNAQSLCQFVFRVSLLEKAGEKMPKRWHATRRRQPYIHPKTGHSVMLEPSALNAVRLEMFASDVLDMCDVVAGLVVDRASEWAYMRHVEGANSAVQAIVALGRTHFDWITGAGGFFGRGAYVDTGDRRCEISPLVSYDGEDLNGLFGIGEVLELPCHIQSAMEKVEIPAHGMIGKRGSLRYVDPESAVEHMEQERLKEKESLPQERSRDATDADDAIAELCSEEDSELPTTPSSLRSEVDNWLEKVQQAQENMEMLSQQKDALSKSAALNLVSTRSNQRKTDAFEDEELTMVARRDLDGVGDNEMDPFEEAIRNPPKREGPMPHLSVLSNIWSRVPNGGQRRFVYSHVAAPPGGHTLFGQEGSYKPAPSSHTRDTRETNAERMDRHKLWKNGCQGADQRFMRGSELPESQKRYQWTNRLPTATAQPDPNLGPDPKLSMTAQPQS